MLQLKISEIIKLIQSQKTFEAVASDNSFKIKVNKYVPYCCTAIHDGSNLRPPLNEKIAINEYGRWYEEDPFTGEFIDALPITLIGLDSRYEYDLNRNPENCIFEEAWGNKVWKKNLSAVEKKVSKQKHANFYKVVAALIGKLESLYGSSIIYDIHSYNFKRWDREVPLFNIGTERIEVERFEPYIENWKQELSLIEIPGVINKTKINDVFFGRGYNLEYITSNFPNSLVLATEVKKVYCNELTGEDYPKIIRELQQKLKRAILNNAQFFSEENTNWKSTNTAHLLDRKNDPAIMKVDKSLFRMLKGFELLAYVNPSNSRAQERRFIKSNYTKEPKFNYAPIKINPFELKQKLSGLKTSDISDISIRQLYESVINSYFDKIDLLSSLNTKKFLFNSLRYFGRPSTTDLVNARYLLHLPPVPSEPKRQPQLHIDEVLKVFKQGIQEYGIDCKIELSKKVISQVMVLNSKKTVLIRPDAKFTKRDINALIEHEIGVHMLTTENSISEKLKIFNLGLPVNTLTGEGLAILSEYLSGNLTLDRLKKIALRVVIVDMMCNGADFIECFNYLRKDQNIDPGEAYTIVTRVFRGGGFTKDYLYLRGFVKILKAWKSDLDLTPLLIGKTSIENYDVINEMIERKIVSSPELITKSFLNPLSSKNDDVYDYILSGLQ